MNALKSLLASFSVAVTLSCPLAEAQQINTASSIRPSEGQSEALGGPVTPTQSSFFSNKGSSILDLTAKQEAISAQTLVLPVKGEPAPLVDDLPRQQEGFLKFKLN
jgi:hypothetical protein